jgi:hypothetical protein
MSEFASFAVEGTFTPTRLWLGRIPLAHKLVTLLSGQNVAAGTLLGRGVVTATLAAATFVGTGTGTLTPANPAFSTAAKQGNYKIVCVEPGADVGTFQVFRPDGTLAGVAVTGVAFTGEIKFTIADGGTDFIVGDTFTVAVTVTVAKYLKSLAAATDSSEEPDCIAVHACDATTGDKECLVYTRGDFDVTGITFGTGHTQASTEAVLRAKGILLVSPAVLAE